MSLQVSPGLKPEMVNAQLYGKIERVRGIEKDSGMTRIEGG